MRIATIVTNEAGAQPTFPTRKKPPHAARPAGERFHERAIRLRLSHARQREVQRKYERGPGEAWTSRARDRSNPLSLRSAAYDPPLMEKQELEPQHEHAPQDPITLEAPVSGSANASATDRI